LSASSCVFNPHHNRNKAVIKSQNYKNIFVDVDSRQLWRLNFKYYA